MASLGLVYRLGEIEHRRELFASAPDQVIAVRLEATPCASPEVGVELWRRFDGRGQAVAGNELEFRGRCGFQWHKLRGQVPRPRRRRRNARSG